jgi:hypothetical protein
LKFKGEPSQRPPFKLAHIDWTHKLELPKYGTAGVNVMETIGGISIDIANIWKHGITGFLRDAATGTIQVKLRVNDIAFEVMGVSAGPLVNFAFDVIDTVDFPVELPEGVTSKSKKGLEIYEWLSGQKLGQFVFSKDNQMYETLKQKRKQMKSKGEDKANVMQEEVEDMQQGALIAALEEKQASEELGEALEEAGAEAGEDTDAKECNSQLKGEGEKKKKRAETDTAKVSQRGGEAVDKLKGEIKHIENDEPHNDVLAPLNTEDQNEDEDDDGFIWWFW